MPAMTASTGFSRDTSVMRADDPWATSTSSSAPAPTASAATTNAPTGLKWASTSRTSSSLSPRSPASLRVDTTVPITCARIIAALLLGARNLRAVDRQHLFEHAVRARDDVHAHDLTHLGRGGRTRLGRGAHRGHVAAHDGRHVAAADLLVVHELHPGGLHHRIGRLDHGHESARLDQS